MMLSVLGFAAFDQATAGSGERALPAKLAGVTAHGQRSQRRLLYSCRPADHSADFRIRLLRARRSSLSTTTDSARPPMTVSGGPRPGIFPARFASARSEATFCAVSDGAGENCSRVTVTVGGITATLSYAGEDPDGIAGVVRELSGAGAGSLGTQRGS